MWSIVRHGRPLHSRTPRASIRCLSDISVFQEGDRVLVQERSGQRKAYLTKPLRANRKLNVHRGAISHESIIGRRPRETVTCSGQQPYRVLLPSLEDYVKLTPRFVTPIYPDTASVIVSQLDIHLSPPAQLDQPGTDRFEILEAGTGHGALTLHLARAVHAANTPPPQKEDLGDTAVTEDSGGSGAASEDPWAESGPLGMPAPFSAQWRAGRRAIVHTLDIVPGNSLNARKVVRGFRRQMYAGDVDFHIGDVSAWLAQETEKRFGGVSADADQSFLRHIVLDLPDSDKVLSAAAAALRADGRLLIWAPSITQVISCVERVRTDNLPLWLDRVLELGEPFSGGREWDIRSALSRSQTRAGRPDASIGTDDGTELAGERQTTPGDGLVGHDKSRDAKWICRPRLDGWTMNMGFLGVFSKMRLD